MKIKYVGQASKGVEIAATGQYALPGVPIEVDDELGESLCEQAVWEPAKPAAKKDSAPAAAKPKQDKPEEGDDA